MTLVVFYCCYKEPEVGGSEADKKNILFDFLIDGLYIQETLEKHFALYNISSVRGII